MRNIQIVEIDSSIFVLKIIGVHFSDSKIHDITIHNILDLSWMAMEICQPKNNYFHLIVYKL